MSDPLNRRSILIASGAALAYAGMQATGAAASSERQLSDLIDAHKSAYERVAQALATWDNIKSKADALEKKRRVLVPTAVMPNGGCSEYCELGPISPNEVRERIRDTHDRLREMHCSKWAGEMFPELAAAAERELNASQERALQALTDALSRIEEQERNFGLDDAQEEVDASDDQEFDARLSLVVYVPRNAAERETKREYIDQSTPFQDAWCADDRFVEAIIARISGFDTDQAIST